MLALCAAGVFPANVKYAVYNVQVPDTGELVVPCASVGSSACHHMVGALFCAGRQLALRSPLGTLSQREQRGRRLDAEISLTRSPALLCFRRTSAMRDFALPPEYAVGQWAANQGRRDASVSNRAACQWANSLNLLALDVRSIDHSEILL